MGNVSGEVTHYNVVLFDAFFIRDDLHVPDCTAKTIAIKNEVGISWFTTRAVCDQVCISLLEPGAADTWTIVYGEFQDSFIFCFMGTEFVSTKGIAEYTSKTANVTVPVTNWDLGNTLWQLVIDAFLFRFRSAHLRCVHWEEGENCLANDQFEKNDPVKDGLNFNNFLSPVLCRSMPACAEKNNLNLQSFPEGCCRPAAEVWNWSFTAPRWVTLRCLMSSICPPCGKVLLGGIVHREFALVPEQVYTTVGQAYHLTLRDSWSPSTWPHCWVSH